MADKKSFVMYKSWKDLFNSLPKDMAGELIQAVFRYQDGEDVDINNPALSAIFTLMQTKFDEDMTAYQNKCNARAEAGKKGGQAKGSKSKQNLAKEANAIFAKQNEANGSKYPPDTDTETDTDTDTDTDIDTVSEKDVPNGTEITDSTVVESVSAKPTASAPNRVPYQEIVNLYNSVCVSLPRVIEVNESRRRAIRSRYKKYGMDGIESVFQMAENSDFLSGRNGGWVGCGFDWLMKSSNFIKVLEGNYENRSSGTGNVFLDMLNSGEYSD